MQQNNDKSQNIDRIVDLVVEEVKKNIGSTKQDFNSNQSQPAIPVGISNHHLHITRSTFQKLFGANTKFENYKDLYQTGEFASKHKVSIIGPKMRPIQGVRILGPFRDYDQVEISATDARYLGITPPVRNSGDLKGACPLTIVGPEGSVYLPECAIIANRHIHMTDADARKFGVQDGDLCKVHYGGEKGVVFENVLVRTKSSYKLQIHLDTDDGNAAGISNGDTVEFYGKM